MQPLLANKRLVSLYPLLRSLSSATSNQVGTKPQGIKGYVDQTVDTYEDFIGVKAVKDAQKEVMKWETTLSQAQMARREKQAEIKSLQARLKEIHFDLDRTSRGEDKYLHLLTEEHAAIKKERSLLEAFEQLETAEREAFYQLSNRVRASHERERERVEKTKWWSVSASLLGALLGIAGASIGNELRMRKLREMLPLGGAQMTEMARIIDDQNEKVTGFISEMKEALKLDSVQVNPVKSIKSNTDLEKVIATIREENARLSEKMAEMSRLAKLEAALNTDPNSVVYVGSEMEHLLEQTERNLESKMKLQTLLSVVFVYAAVGVTIPLVFAFLRGG